MPTPIFICGAECGIAAVGTLSAGTEHWAAINGTPTVVTSGPSPMRSTRCFRFNTTAATAYLQHTYATAVASPATVPWRFYIYFATLPSADCRFAASFGNDFCYIYYESSDSTIRGDIGGTQGASGVAVATGQWYRIDAKAVHAATVTLDVSVDGVACAQVTKASAAAVASNIYIGNMSAVTADYYIDDLIVSGTSADYPIGAGTVAGLYPNADRTNGSANPATSGTTPRHFFSATTDFAKGASGAVATGAQNAESTSWQSLAKPLSTSIGTNWIADLAGASTELMAWDFDNMPADAATVNGGMIVSTHHAASATTCLTSLTIFDPGVSSLSFIAGLDLSETTICTNVSLPDRATYFASVSMVNGLAISFASADVNPDPYLDGICLEVDYVQSVASFIAEANKPILQAVNRSAVW